MDILSYMLGESNGEKKAAPRVILEGDFYCTDPNDNGNVIISEPIMEVD